MADKIKISSMLDVQGNYEPSDSENEYSPKEKNLLHKLRKRKLDESGSEEEVYAFSDSDDNDNDKNDLGIADSDVEGQGNSDDDLPDSKAWGKKKQSYYSTDYVDEDYGGYGDEEEDALMEEEEAKNIQKRLIEQLGEEDFSLEFFNTTSADNDVKEKTIKSDLSKMSKRQKLQIFEKESPEFAGLVDDFKTKLTVAKDDLQPVLELVKGGKFPKCPASKFIKTNYDLILNYCTNISFYLLLKSQRISIQNHPVIKRLYQYRQMLNKMEPIYLEIIKPQIDKILLAVKNKLELTIVNEIKKERKKRKNDRQSSEHVPKKLKLVNELEKDDGEDTGVSDDDDDESTGDNLPSVDLHKLQSSNSNQINVNESEESGFSDNDEFENEDKPSTSHNVLTDDIGEKREITYQIAKNKGLTPHRKKEQRNPRVKHKLKYRKAKIRRKGAIREPRKEIARYGGEASGIKANVKKSIKIK